MKLTILTGPGEVKKRDFLVRAKARYSADSISTINLKSDPANGFEKLQNALLSLSLFEVGDRLIVVEQAVESLDLQKLNLPDDKTLELMILFASAASTSTLLKSAQKLKQNNLTVQVINFPAELEVNAFAFLDFLIEGQTQAYSELEKLYPEYGAQYILTMIYYLLRRNLLPPPQSDFMKRKILKQKQHFETPDWQKLYKQTLETDFAIKSGVAEEKTALSLLIDKFIRQPQA